MQFNRTDPRRTTMLARRVWTRTVGRIEFVSRRFRGSQSGVNVDDNFFRPRPAAHCFRPRNGKTSIGARAAKRLAVSGGVFKSEKTSVSHSLRQRPTARESPPNPITWLGLVENVRNSLVRRERTRACFG